MNSGNSYLIENGKPKFFYGYIVVAAAFSIQMATWGISNIFGIFLKPLSSEFGWSRATISGAASLSYLLMGFLSIIGGRLTDRFGPRVVISTCGFFLGLGYLLMSQISTLWQLYLVYGLIIGIGLSAIDVSLLSTIARWFVKRRGTMSGTIKVGASLGLVIMSMVAGWLISTYSWRTSYIILGIITLVFIIPAAQLLRRDPDQMRQLPNGKEQAKTDSINSAEVGLSLREAIHTKQFWVICAIYLTIMFCVMTIIIHIVPHAIDIGISATSAASIISTIGLVSMISRPGLGSISDRIGNKLGMIICFLILVVALFWLQLSDKLWMLYLFATLYGLAHGGFFAITSPLVAELFGMASLGVIFGIVFFSGTIGGAIGPVLAGSIFDMTGSYQLAFLISAGVSIIGLILSLQLKPISR